MVTPTLPSPSNASGFAIRKDFAEAARFWEPLRIGYNLVLLGVVATWLIATWPHFRPAIRLVTLVSMALLALVANACYCAAYAVDIPMQHGARKFLLPGRWILWTAGTLLAMLLANYWMVDEIYPDVH